MRLLHLASLGIGLFLPGLPLLAQQTNCTNPQTQTEMNICAGISLQKSNRQLNQVYQTLLPKLSNTEKRLLSAVQMRWMQFRDNECTFASSRYEGGSIQPLIISTCKDNLTRQRTSDLTAYLQGKPISPKSSNYSLVDRDLNQRYQQLRQTLSPEYQQNLETAELSWINYRNAACEFEASRSRQDARTPCLIRLTEQRTQQLISYLKAKL
jgi:uncharacterized protein YecT (DUF1311 family)